MAKSTVQACRNCVNLRKAFDLVWGKLQEREYIAHREFCALGEQQRKEDARLFPHKHSDARLIAYLRYRYAPKKRARRDMDYETIRRLREAAAWLESDNAKINRSGFHAVDDETPDAMIARAAHFVANPLVRPARVHGPPIAESKLPSNVIPFRPSRNRATKELVEQ
jgi:hypothetical protein